MIEKVTVFLALLAFARTDTTVPAPYFTPATSVSPAYSPIDNPPNYKAKPTPAPIYEEDASTQGTGANSVNRIGQESLKSFNSVYPDSRNFHAHNINAGAILTPNTYDQTISAPISYSPAYSLSSPLTAKIISGPVTYTTHTHSTPFEERTQTVNFHKPLTQNEAIKTTITYAEAPSVSHVTFTGLGTTYTWKIN